MCCHRKKFPLTGQNFPKCAYVILETKMSHKGRPQKKNVKFGLLAEIRRGRGLRGIQEPNLLSGSFTLFKNYLIAPKHEKALK